MSGYTLFVPEILLLVGALWALFADVLPGGDRGSAWVAAVVSAGAGVIAAFGPHSSEVFAGLLEHDARARFARTSIAFLATAWFVWVASRGTGDSRRREAVFLTLTTAIGAMLMAAAADLITLYISMELTTMSVYVLIGYRRGDADALEGAFKYFLLSVLTSLVMLYGFSWLYGLSGSTRIAELSLEGSGAIGLLGGTLAIVGLLAKISAVPFQWWAPDAYAGTRPWAIAVSATLPKIAGVTALVRLFDAVAPDVPPLVTVMLLISAASMVLGNLAALTQDDMRRLMAYSGIAHAGYLLLGVAALSSAGGDAAVFYAAAYAVPTLGVMLATSEEGTRIESWGQLASRRPALAWAGLVWLLSLIGIPPLVGFFGKFAVFGSAIEAGFAAVVVLAVAMSVVSAGYYLRIVRSMFFGDVADRGGELHEPVERSFGAAAVFAAVTLAVFAMGIGSGALFAWLSSV
jgi:NADH-quinone oxidoreductase subunit N